MKIVAGPMVKPLGTDTLTQTCYTRYKVRGETRIHEVRVDRGGLWSCNCRSSSYKGNCYHVWMVKMSIFASAFRQIPQREIEVIDVTDFRRYYRQERFLAEPFYRGCRNRLYFGRNVWLGLEQQHWDYPGVVNLAGTVLEGCYTERFGPKQFVLVDCLYYKGTNYTGSPLVVRKEMLEKAFKVFKGKTSVGLGDYVVTEKDKEVLRARCQNHIVLKDISSAYIQVPGESSRAWLVPARGEANKAWE